MNKIPSESNPTQLDMTCPRLSLPQVGIVATICCALLGVIPTGWHSIEEFQPETNYRIPYELSRDYGHIERLLQQASNENAILMLGDSAIWGEYALPDETLSAALSQMSDQRFANVGVNGMHPLALEGLANLHLSQIRKSKVILHCNLLWLSSPERDLSAEEAQSFNHSQLVSQFARRIPSYQTTLANRVGIVVQRQLPFRKTVFHVRTAYFEGNDLHRWTLQNPYDNPMSAIGQLPRPSEELRHAPKSWRQSRIPIQNYRWVDIDESLQWQAMQSTVRTLSQDGHDVLVLVGPFNVHLLSEENAKIYRGLRAEICHWFENNAVTYVAPTWLASDLYADASHPLADGYAELAEVLLKNKTFFDWL